MVRKVEFIPETRYINTLFKEMQSEKMHMVIVVDEYGQTIVKNPDGSFLINGMADFEDVAKTLAITVAEEDDYETLNGYLIAKLGKIPDEEDQEDRTEIIAGGYSFKILAVNNKIIQKVSVCKIPDTEDEANYSCHKQEIMLE